MASSGVIVRDHEGSVLLTAWKVLRHCSSREEAEAEACLHGYSGCQRIIEYSCSPTSQC
jgi:hypothetical protein